MVLRRTLYSASVLIGLILISCTTSRSITVSDDSFLPTTLVITSDVTGELTIDDESYGQVIAGKPREIEISGDRQVRIVVAGEEKRQQVNLDLLAGTRIEVAGFVEAVPSVVVEGGTFRMGDDSDGDDDERPVHVVRLSDFIMMAMEVTCRNYDAFVLSTGHREPRYPGWGRGSRPIVDVSWYDAVTYANWLSEQDGFTPVYRIDRRDVKWNRNADGWRLPTEAEWEYAARGGLRGRDTTYAGSDRVAPVAWYHGNSESQTHPVGRKPANELGLYDMSGIVWEWCWDWYADDYYKVSSATNPRGPRNLLNPDPESHHRVLRGGCWVQGSSEARVSNRYSLHPGVRNYYYGFRLVRSSSHTSGL